MIFFAHQWRLLTFAKIFLYFLFKIERFAPPRTERHNHPGEDSRLIKDASIHRWRSIDDLGLYGEQGCHLLVSK